LFQLVLKTVINKELDMDFYLSYSEPDALLKDRVAHALEQSGHHVSVTQYGLSMAEYSTALTALTTSIRAADAVILLLSLNAARDENVETDVEIALRQEIPIWPVIVHGEGAMAHFPLPRSLRGKSGAYCDLRLYPDRVVEFLGAFFVQCGLALNNNSQAEVDWYDLAIAVDPNNAAAYHRRGNVYGERGERQKAIADFSASIRLNSSVPEPYANRARQYRLTKQYNLALADCDAALRLDGKHRMAYIICGNIETERGHYEQAIAAFDAALALDPRDALSYANRGNAKRLSGQTEAALADCKRALEIDPNRWLAQLIRGQVYCGELEKQKTVARTDERLKLALDAFNAVLAKVENGDAYYGRARVRYWMGDVAGAVADCQKTLLGQPSHPAAERMRMFISQQQKKA
jgi:tetratricopeptide (TPR) repeat protein